MERKHRTVPLCDNRVFPVRSQSFVSVSSPESIRLFSGPTPFCRNRPGALWMLRGRPGFVASSLSKTYVYFDVKNEYDSEARKNITIVGF